MDALLAQLSLDIGILLQQNSMTLATAESCTGGWVAQVITHTAGSSAWFDRGFVTYSNAAKQDQLGVSAALIATQGAVSEATAQAMAAGALQHSLADVALSITGIAGPSGGSADKPVGTVCFGWCLRGKAAVSRQQHFDGDREQIRYQSVVFALQRLQQELRP
jgi:nicotinamide-nucleotide amidase